MKKLGNVKNVIHDGSILLQALGTPVPGTRVCDMRGAEVGKVARVFGPVDAPYVSVKPKPGTETVGLLGTALYLCPEDRVRHDRAEQRFVPRNRSAGPGKKKGVKAWQRKGKPRKK